MDYSRLKKQLRFDEGYRCEIYLDTEGLPTFGVGHLLTKNDVEFDTYKRLKKGEKITVSAKRIEELFDIDLNNAIDDCKNIFKDFNKFSSELQEILVNMAFALGRPRFMKFKKFIAAIHIKNFDIAAKELEDSLWYRKVRDRGVRLYNRLKAL
jgi:GH24 family phage-related lysozyme (muramidase)